MNNAMSLNNAVRKIPATLKFDLRAAVVRLRVCAYARVSTDDKEQMDSYHNQVKYYTGYIQNKAEWTFVKIFADPGISGTKAAKRPGFLEMIEACRAGLIDKIICKSVQRFARNTVEALAYIRELKELGISIVFENEGIDTMTPGGEVLITILAGMAEQESRNISLNVKKGYQMKFQKGEIMMSTKYFLGYARDKDNNIIIEPNQAVIVRRIFREFLTGYTTVEIAKRLEDDGIPSPGGKETWRAAAVRAILMQDKYTGNSIMGKTFKTDVLSNRRQNKGQEDMFYIPNSHPAIISQETFDLAKAEMNRRANVRSVTKTGDGRYSAKHPFSGILVCGNCGSNMRRFLMGYTKYRTKTANWVCSQKLVLKSCCELPVKEDAIQSAFLRAINELIADKGAFLSALRENIHARASDRLHGRIEEIEHEIMALQQTAMDNSRANRMGTLGNDDYDRAISEIERKMAELNADKSQAIMRTDQVRLLKYRLDEIERILEKCTNLTEPDEMLFRELLEMVVATRQKVAFRFKCGIEKEVELG